MFDKPWVMVMTSEYWIKSFMLPWMDPAAASTRKTYTTSHGATRDLVISDELNAEGRSFDPGDDQLRASMNKVDSA
ncbi:hypothetical protein PI124_g7609 [Phytophthora idaei]|nr:hypothetical protein PI126_g6871 [Phytophthora idaei]KAG3247711.1 hypothetical protein PI124_g7609 [Phytophthora idaei]